MKNKNIINISGSSLSIENLINIAEKGYKVELNQETEEIITAGRKKLIKQITGEKTKHIQIYGVNVGCGDLKDVNLTDSKELSEKNFEPYQVQYIKAHNCATGKPLGEAVVRAIMVIRLNSFARGMSGMRPETCQFLIELLNRGVTPWILEEGSVGASGDLVPLAMLGAVMLGLKEAKAYYQGELLSAPIALQKAGLEPTVLGAKEAMGLTNGSNFIASLAVFCLRDADRLLKTASISTALSLEAIRGENRAFGSLINEKSERHSGQIAVARQIRNLISNSMRTTKAAQEYKEFLPRQNDENSKINKERVQDRYSFRCAPQVHGTVYEAIEKLRDTLFNEINSCTDNPLFDFDNDIPEHDIDGNPIMSVNFASGGNFHGQALAVPVDTLKMTLTSLGLISDRRSFSLLSKHLSYGLPQDLAVEKEGKNKDGNTGYMIAQYAGAARAAENRILSTPASVMSVATAANQEDYVSMGSIGVVHLQKIIANLEIILAIELLCATRGLQLTYNNLPEELRSLGDGTKPVYNKLKSVLGDYTGDNYIRTELEKIIELVHNGDLIRLAGEHL